MKWYTKEYIYNNGNKFKNVKKFLFFPCCISGVYRWFEFVIIQKQLKQRKHVYYYNFLNEGRTVFEYKWFNVKFIDKVN